MGFEQTRAMAGWSGERLMAALAVGGEDPFVAVVGATHVAVAISDPRLPDNPVVFVNDSFCRLTGYQAADVIGRNCRFLQGPDTDPAAIAAITAAVAGGRAIEVDLVNYRRDGTPFWNRLTIAPAFDRAGGITHFFASQSDVTADHDRVALLENDNASLSVEVADRRGAQHASEARLRFTTEAARIAVWEVTLPGLELTATPTFNAIYGLPPDATPVYEEVRARIHPDDAPRVREALDGAGRDGSDGSFHFVYRIRHASGDERWVEVRGQVERADGRPARIVGVSQDVTARRVAEIQLELSEESLRLATEAAGIGTWDLDLPTDTLVWSDRTRAMFGISPGVPVGMADFYAGLHPDDRDATGTAFAAAIDPARRAAYDVEYRTIGKEDGIVRWVAAKGSGLFSDGRCTRAVGTVIDVTRARREADRQRFLLTLADLLRRQADPNDILRTALTALGREVGAHRVGYGQVQGDDRTIVLTSPYVTDAVPLEGSFPLETFGAAMIAHNRAGETIVVPDVDRDPRLELATWRRIGTRSFVSVALVRDARFRATLFVNRANPGPWSDDDVTLIEEVAGRTWEAVERARAEAESQATGGRLQAVIAAAPVGLVFAEAPDGRITGGNARAEAILRHPVRRSANIAHYREWDSFHADGRRVDGPEYPLARALAGEELPEIEALYRRGDGTDAWLRFIAAPVRGADGTIVGGAVAIMDIDRERRAELALRDLNATLARRVAETVAARDAVWRESRDMLLILTADGIIEAVNPAWTETLGYQPEALIGRRYLDFVVADDMAASDSILSIVQREPIRGFANRYRHADGSTRDLAWTAASSAGRIYCVARDVTHEKAAARELATAQEALRQSQKMEAVGQLTGGIAHDFNNMLAVVLGSLDLLARRSTGGDARTRRYIDAATDGARRAAALTQRLLAFSRQQPLQPEPLDVNRLVTGMSDLLRGSLGGSVQLETVLAGGLWPVNADPNQLENVILNLAINARDAMAGDGRVTIETANADLDDRARAAEIGVAAGQYARIAVIDAGSGMPPDVVAKAFDPFFTTKGVGKGTGLGLSQVYGFVRQSGGDVKIRSEVGVGTTVELYLPRLVGGVPASPVASAAAAPVRGDARETVLVVEDEAAVRAVTVEALRELGYRVLEADGAAAALPLIAAHDVALLLTDIVMPEVNGARLAETARAARPGLKVLFTTGYTRDAVVHDGVVDPGVALIGKPFTVDALAGKVRAVLDGD